MAINYQNSLELLEDAIKEKLYSKLVAQLKKDFELANVVLEEVSDLGPKSLIAILREKIYHLILERFADYLNLLYIVDVPEVAFKDLKVTDAVEVADQVTFLVLKRVRQKVWLKAKYSS